jgi:hypothetical protein
MFSLKLGGGAKRLMTYLMPNFPVKIKINLWNKALFNLSWLFFT